MSSGIRHPPGYPPAYSWHPKITPYRLAFIMTTGVLGIAKAALVATGETAPSITVEWVAAVVVTLSFQFLDEWQSSISQSSRGNNRLKIECFFNYDLLHIAKRCTARVRALHLVIPSPSGSVAPLSPKIAGSARLRISDAGSEQRDTPNPFEASPLVTIHRLAVSIIVSSFGIAKMIFTYTGISPASNTLDWVIAVPLTLGLYYIGLYEEVQLSTPRRLFDIDYSSQTKLVIGMGLFYIIGTAFCLTTTSMFLDMLVHSALDFPQFLRDGPATWGPVMEREWWVLMTTSVVQLTGVVLFCGVILLGGLGLTFFAWPVFEFCMGLLRLRRVARTVRRYVLGGSVYVFSALGVVVFMGFAIAALCLLVSIALLVFG